jgi:hypothetical protein
MPHIKRDTIRHCLIEQQVYYNWMNPVRPVALIMDSMAELGDQMFIQKESEWRFLASYSDIDHSQKFQENFSCLGLLDVDNIESYFRVFIKNVRNKYGKIPIYYLNFPPCLETREEFINRHNVINKVTNKMEIEFDNFFPLSVGCDVVDYPNDDYSNANDFPYHYNMETYEAFAELIYNTGTWNFS